MNDTTVTMRQFHIIVVFTTLSTAFFLLPSSLIADAKQHAWLVPLWTGAAGIASTLPWIYLARRHARLNLMQINERILGRPFGKLANLMLLFHMVIVCAWVLNNLDDFMTTTLMQQTKEWVFDAAFLFTALYAAQKGITAIARTAELFAPMLIAMFSVFFVLAVHSWDWSQFAPAAEFDWSGILRKPSYMIAFPFMDGFMFVMIFPYIKEKAGANYVKCAAAGALLLSLITFIVTGVLGVSRAPHVTFPLFVMAQELMISSFLEHMEATIAILWFALVFVKLSFTFYCAITGIAQTCGMRSGGLIAVPLAILIVGFAQSMHRNLIENLEWLARYLLPYYSLNTLALPLLLIAVDLIRRRRAA
ncbi:GerAB/ArcD/ProY family transporter [Paenibacillus sacheonensis]|uniref:Endospore germination permease n=1 Tax=Paenibacillus sacheonensis TaxID=742054 RepID=A0A7X5C498_9BACL|nr:endospore germination permease [Paenibacillus sacheonensis]MBM7566596.1 spore germination protein KB [Paenibacillus sacheonensis]NBC73095.1 endospore germination permease [Paenibacillus sacheonensis]